MLCQCPKLTPLQSRLLASVSALALLGLIYWSLSNPHFAYAAELSHDGTGKLRQGNDHNWHRIREQDAEEDDDEELVKRETKNTQFQGNNIGTPFDISTGDVVIWEYPNRFLTQDPVGKGAGFPSDLEGKRVKNLRHPELRKRDEEHALEVRQTAGKTIYISANTCRQPYWVGTGTQDAAPPQLTLYVSNSAGNKNLGPGGSGQTVHPFDGGFVNASVPNASGTWHVAVSAPELSGNFSGFWNYEMAVSIDDFFHAAEPEDSFLYLVDTDYDSALFVTDNLTEANASTEVYQKWLDLSAPFVMFAVNQNLTGTMGLENSFCGLETFVKNNSQIQASQSDLQGNGTGVQMGMITRGLGQKPKEQFYVTNLNSSSRYRAFLAMDGNSTASGDGVVQGGGKVWGAGVNFTTKRDGNCQLLFNLTFCEEVAYAVPANPNNANFSTFADLQHFYENYTKTWYPPFNYTLAQVPCNTTSDAQYSLAKDCTSCAAAYKEWLCAISIPRCEDFSNTAPYLQPRNVGQQFYNNDSMLDDTFLNSRYIPMPGAPTLDGSVAFQQTYISSFATNRSRNGQIDDVIRPGPYKEVLPCEDLCYSLMQSCPASMQFACPYPGRGLEASYGKRSPSGEVTCSYLGAYYYQNNAAGVTNVLLKASISAMATVLVMALV